jgi:hypothetical protein
MHPNNKIDFLEEFAKSLVINYYNVSLKETKGTPLPNIDALSQIFEPNSKLAKNPFTFCRNILIIGSGAAKNELSFLSTGDEAIKKIEENLKLGEILTAAKGKLKNRYRRLASHYKKTLFSSYTEIKDVQAQLGFEGRLSMLLNFYEKQDVLDEIKRIIDFQYLYCRFYFIIAQFFKNRLIDVIINFNFDELLDNAIDEEMSNYHKIVHDSDCKSISELIDNNRIRIPIYIKPHGTISSKTSLLFTKEQYIDMSEDMKNLLNDIFIGKVATDDDDSRIENINIIVAGFAMESIELNNILFSLHQGNLMKEINIYLFLPDPDVTAENLTKLFENWKKDNNILNSKSTYKTPQYKPVPVEIGQSLDEPNTLTDYFIKIYDRIRDKFNMPFKPVELKLGRVFSLLFPIEEMHKIGIELIDPDSPGEQYKNYLKNRFIFHLLCEVVKWKGKIAINVVISERPGRYFQQYKAFLKRRKRFDELLLLPDIITFIDQELKIEMNPNKDSPDNIYECKFLFKNDSEKHNDLKAIARCIVKNSLAPYTEDLVKEVRKFLSDHIYNKRTYQINSHYDDIRHVRFHYFRDEQIMPTNLNLTFKFFEYSVLKGRKNPELDWDTLCFAGESGKPIYNLHRYYKDDSSIFSFLEQFIDFNDRSKSKTVKLLYSEDEQLTVNESDFKDNIEGHPSCDLMINDVLSNILKSNFVPHEIKSSLNIHHMALFIKDGRPIYGIYIFRPEAKSKINPVWFDISNPEKTLDYECNDSKNLIKMMDIFYKEFPQDN